MFLDFHSGRRAVILPLRPAASRRRQIGGITAAAALPAVSDLISCRSFSVDQELLEPAESHSNLEARPGDRPSEVTIGILDKRGALLSSLRSRLRFGDRQLRWFPIIFCKVNCDREQHIWHWRDQLVRTVSGCPFSRSHRESRSIQDMSQIPSQTSPTPVALSAIQR